MAAKYSWPLPGEGVTATELMRAEAKTAIAGLAAYSNDGARDALLAEIIAALFNGQQLAALSVSGLTVGTVAPGGGPVFDGFALGSPLPDNGSATTIYTPGATRIHQITVLGRLAAGSSNISFVDVLALDTSNATWTISVVSSTTIGGLGNRTYTQSTTNLQLAIAGAGTHSQSVTGSVLRFG